MKKKKAIICLLLTITCFIFLFGCASNTNENSTTTATQQTTLDDDITEEEAILLLPKKVDYNREYRMLVTGNGAEMNYWKSTSDGISGQVVNDALYNRSALMEDEFGVEVVVDIDGDASSKLSNVLTSGDFLCDVSFIKAVDSFKLVQKGLYNNLSGSSQLNLGASYWDQRIQSEYAINDKIYLLEGDFSIYDELRTYVILYNDGIYNDYNYTNTYGSLYNLVKDEKWTLATMMKMCKDMYLDLNHNNVRDEADQYGTVGELTMVYYMFLGSGYKTIANNNGKISLLIKDQTYYSMIYDVFENTMQLAVNDDILMPQLLTCDDIWTAASNVFEKNRALFRSTSLSAALRLGNMEQRYGILPIPAYEEGQGGYYCWVSGNNHTPLAVPITVVNFEENLAITEAFCFYSHYGSKSLYQAFFETFRLAKLCQTAEDLEMLDLVFNSKTFDFDQTVKITGIESAMFSLAKQKDLTTLSSTLTGLKDSAQAQLNKFLLEMAKK